MLSEEKKAKGTAVALGYFDGIHLGHKAVLGKALRTAEETGLTPVVMLFDIHPRKLLTGRIPPMLLTEERKRFLLKEMGFEVTPSVANFVFAKSDKISGEDLYKRLKERGILVRHFTKERIKDYNRITIGSEEDMNALATAIKEILEK